jgi:hypothetical protein
MFLYPSAAEGLAWLTASDDSWGARAVNAYEAAVERGPDETPADTAP